LKNIFDIALKDKIDHSFCLFFYTSHLLYDKEIVVFFFF